MSSWPNPLSPSPSNLSHTLTGTHTHYQHISPHWHLPHSVQAGSGNPTAQKTYIKHFSFRKLQTCLSPSIRSENTRTSCLQPALTVSFTVQQTGCQTVRFQEWPFNRDCATLSLKPCELQRPIPNHQSSFCWIFLLLLTLSIIRSSCPPSHRWASLGFHFAGLNPISPVGLSGWPGEGRYPKHINSLITPSTSVRNLGVIFDDQLTFKEHIAKTARSCRFALHNIRKIRPFLTEHAAQLLVQALVVSRLDYCNALLAGLPSNTIKPLQMIQNAVARLVFNEPKRTHVTPLFISLHWLPVAARIKFKTLMLAYRTTTGSAPSYFHSLLRIYIPSRSLRSASERRLVVPSQRGSKSLSRTFSFTIPGWWNNLPTPIRNAGSLSIFKQQLKTHLFRHYLT